MFASNFNYDHSANSTGPGSPTQRASFQEAAPNSPPLPRDFSGSLTLSPGSSHGRPGVVPETEESTLAGSVTNSHSFEELAAVRDEEAEREDVKSLARQYTQQSIRTQTDKNPFNAEPGSELDASSDNFNAKAWMRAMFKLRNEDSSRFKGRTAGVCFKDLSAYGFGTAADFQSTVGTIGLQAVGVARQLAGTGKRRINILRNFDGLVHAGEMLVVLGPPGSGCSTFLKTIAGETNGFYLDASSHVNYQGIPYNDMHKHFRGEAIYTAEQDVHFPQLTVGDTLYFAARARAPKYIPGGVSVHEYAIHMRDMIMATFGIRHTINTKVGNDFIRGVSGGERKRVSIAEAALSGAPLQCWDNSTRGLDSANAIEFCKTLRLEAEISKITAAVAIYQAPQSAYDIFDKAIVLYEGRQIYFGNSKSAKQYFINLGFECADRQTDADFLTSMTNPNERIIRRGFENRAPRTPDEFATAWKNSDERKVLMEEIDQYERDHPVGGHDLEQFKESRKLQQSNRQRLHSPYTLSYVEQIQLCLWRGFKRLKADPSLTLTALIGNFAMALIIASVFYNLPATAESFFSRGALLFYAVLMAAFSSALEILIMYAQRPIVEKHTRYALYHASAEAFASALCDMPYKTINTFTFNIPIYFLTNLRREPGPFFFFVLFSYIVTLTMSMIFRTMASVSRTLSQALVPAAIFILGLVMYTGFAIPTTYMLGWSRWINYIDPVAYAFESIMINEFSGRHFPCTTLTPPYGSLEHGFCNAVGSVPGQSYVDGDVYLASAYNYEASHRWRNFGILWAFMLFFFAIHLLTTEYIQAKKSKGEVLVFRRGHIPQEMKKGFSEDPEDASSQEPGPQKEEARTDASNFIQKQTAIFQWRDLCYDIKIKGEPRRILDNVDGWIKPGTLTALMGVSGAGKTTLLDVLATRVTMGVITGEILVDGKQRDSSFQRKTGYVQQQDLHLETSTVREALVFSALLRQPAHVSRKEKIDYVEEVIKLLEMEQYADAVVGVPGEGLNVEQRKRLTIGVELAAKPQLLLFLDEPTSGLDSQTSWSILSLLEKLKQNGQAILCTIHQPSAILFQRFDRLLFLAKGGRTVYFGPVGESSRTMIDYFEKNGAHSCPSEANPAEWMLEVIGAAPGSHTEIDWFETWRNSPEYQEVSATLDQLKAERSRIPVDSSAHNKADYREFAAPFLAQYYEVQKRVFEQYWRTPTYIYAKIALCVLSALFIGFSFFHAPNTQQGLTNQMFGLFMLMTIFGQLCQQIMPVFVTQRSLYEVRERPSKAFSWQAFILSFVVAEIPWNLLCATLLYCCWYYPIGLYRNAEVTNTVHERGGLMWMLVFQFLMFTSTFAHMVVAGIDTAETAGNVANLVFALCLIFCGVLAGPTALPGFWIFMYRVSPFTYLIAGMLSTAVRDTSVQCASNEYHVFTPPPNQTCGEFMGPYISQVGGYLQNDAATDNCSFCSVKDTNTFLGSVSINPADTWRNFGLLWVFIVFNVFGALFLYWLARVPKNNGRKVKEEQTSGVSTPNPETTLPTTAEKS
ncbi:putative ABC transporter [Talaromyces proteolyticus]|uniref:ABC transporter n=1 Tax=Talaromyces proteolyticus TaxID=1131652 RepID=A0AAD4KZ04_9EURO|nr:putative ABC transporter [Talaromyces proteolyticus]KAH8703208.1 putative ABC transporter [Talaromyces proteolyticus]